MTTADALNQGRESFERQAWSDAYALLSVADDEESLGTDDLERLAIAAHLVGRSSESAEILARAHQECIRRGYVTRAVRCAFWIAFGLLNRGEMAQGGGWLARARRLLDESNQDCVEQGYLLVPVGLQSVMSGNTDAACAAFSQAASIGERFHDRDLVAIARHGQGRALIYQGKTAEGLALLDEAMVAVTSGEVSEIIAGIVYCSVIEACNEIYDLRRAQEWTAALNHWCESQPDLVPYRGQCLVHRAQIMQLHGAWQDALDETERACEQLAGEPAMGEAFYQQGELHRLRGEFAKAEEDYRQASQYGRQPEPGLAQLRLAQGQIDIASAATRRMLDESQDPMTRARLLPAHVEIMLAEGNVQAARAATDELSEIAENLNAPFLHAMSAHSTGAVLLSEGDVRAALTALRHAWTAWQALEAPCEAARSRLLIGLCCRELGDEDTAQMELDAARLAFQQLGAAPDLARVDALSSKKASKTAGGLTPRETQVLRLVASGKTNRAIATDLFISEKTVDRHVSNIFIKLNLSSRSAATAYAYENDLL